MERIVITGATGWMGRAMVKSLITKHGLDILSKIELYGSRKQSITIDSKLILEIEPLNTIKFDKNIDLFVPLAFLTQEKYNSLGRNDYQSINRKIISAHLKIFSETQPKSTIYFTSGITNDSSEVLSRPESYAEYKTLKLEEARSFESLTNSFGINLITCKLFSMSGQYMRDPKKYALGDFILQAAYKKQIHIQSSSLVFRKYFQDVDLCALMIQLSESETSMVVESTGFLIELGELAKLVGTYFGIPKSSIVRRKIGSENQSDNYYSNDTVMENLFEQHNIKPRSLSQQIESTIEGVMALAREKHSLGN